MYLNFNLINEFFLELKILFSAKRTFLEQLNFALNLKKNFLKKMYAFCIELIITIYFFFTLEMARYEIK